MHNWDISTFNLHFEACISGCKERVLEPTNELNVIKNGMDMKNPIIG
jgi:hypothetical protein